MSRHEFPHGQIFFRQEGEEYSDVAERVLPDIIVGDDCASIGGEKEMAHPHIKPETKRRIRSIVVPEGRGIHHLPNNLAELMNH